VTPEKLASMGTAILVAASAVTELDPLLNSLLPRDQSTKPRDLSVNRPNSASDLYLGTQLRTHRFVSDPSESGGFRARLGWRGRSSLAGLPTRDR
jgi:hypothetical protein